MSQCLLIITLGKLKHVQSVSLNKNTLGEFGAQNSEKTAQKFKYGKDINTPTQHSYSFHANIT